MAPKFSEDGKYFAYISSDGKLKIWDTIANSFDQEFTPDFHLTSPCTCLHFIQSISVSNKGSSPRKKKRRESESNLFPSIALGTTSGQLLVYSLSKANLECAINSETSQSISCLSSVDDNTFYSGSDQDILVWSLQLRKLLDKWKGGNEKISAVLVIPDSHQLLTASKNIKLWDVKTKEIVRTFTGHSSEITFLHYLSPKGKNDAYFITGSKGDRLLNCWNLSDTANNKNTVVSFLMEDIVQNISVIAGSDGCTRMAATLRSGVVHVYHHTLNGKCNKPLKPKTTIQVVSDTGQNKELVTPIRIIGAVYRDEDTLCIGHGTELLLTFENITIGSKKINCLVRKDPRVTTSSTDEFSKIHTPIVNNDEVHYLTSQTSSVTKTTKRKNEGQMEVPMEKRLENLTLTKLEGSSQVPKVDNVAQLLMQGLHSKDKNILRTVLCNRDESVIKNTVKRLPIQLLIPLVQELLTYIQGKTLSSGIGCMWLRHVLQIHAGILMSNPELPELLGAALGSIENRLTLLTPLNKLKGRLELLISQMSSSSSSGQEFVENDEQPPLLIFNDKDSSDSDEEDMQFDNRSESENEWEDESTEEAQGEENNVDSESDMSS